LSQRLVTDSTSVRLLSEPVVGFNNTLVVVEADQRRWAVKMYAHARTERAVAEHEALNALAGRRLAPDPGFVDTSGAYVSYPVVVYRWLDGESFSVHQQATTPVSEILDLVISLRDHARTLRVARRCHMNPVYPLEILSQMRGRIEFLAGRAKESQITAPATVAVLSRAWEHACRIVTPQEHLTGPAVFCHGDPGLNNIVTTPQGELRLVDWEYAGMGDTAYELAYFLHHPRNTAVRDTARALISAGPVRTLATSQDIARFVLYDRLMPLRWAVRCFHVAESRKDENDGNRDKQEMVARAWNYLRSFCRSESLDITTPGAET
jgi:aminoglycoside phosphotransferase (APT) family kinase protein